MKGEIYMSSTKKKKTKLTPEMLIEGDYHSVENINADEVQTLGKCSAR